MSKSPLSLYIKTYLKHTSIKGWQWYLKIYFYFLLNIEFKNFKLIKFDYFPHPSYSIFLSEKIICNRKYYKIEKIIIESRIEIALCTASRVNDILNV
jgi:hypothetical protein